MNIGFIDWWGNEIPFSEIAETSDCHWPLPKQIILLLAESCQRERYVDISVTELFTPLRKYLLEQRTPYFVYPEKVFDRFEGIAMHKVLAEATTTPSLVELKLCTEIEGIIFGGTLDYYHEGVITDYKWTKRKTLERIKRYGVLSAKPGWCQQINAYAWLMKQAVSLGASVSNDNVKLTKLGRTEYPEVHDLQLWLRVKDAAWGNPMEGITAPFISNIETMIRERIAKYLHYRLSELPDECEDKGRLCDYCDVRNECFN